MMPREFHLSPDAVIIQLNRIARTLRTHALRDAPTAACGEMFANAARDIEDVVYEASKPEKIGLISAAETIAAMPERMDWRTRFEELAETDPDALFNWWHYGFEQAEESAV